MVGKSAYAADVESVYNVTIKGQTYGVVELLSVQREVINPLNILRFKRGAEYHAYRLIDSDYPLRVYDQDWIPNKDQFKDVPDRRDFDTRHPYAKYAETGVNVVISFVGLFL